MPPEYLFGLVAILLPVAALSGWYYGRKSLGDHRKSAQLQSPSIAPDYFKGLNYLLNDRTDKAIEVFIKVLDVDSDTAETHLALGNLFRRRGEVDRAIRVHQNLVARPSLDQEQRGLALLELGLDYMRAGLLDRAESLFKELLEMGRFEHQALGHLIDIFQQEQDWNAALEYLRRFVRITGENRSGTIAHFFCEKAQLLIDEGEYDEGSRLLAKALREDRNCVRARLMLADVAHDAGDHSQAINHLKKIEEQDLAFLPEAIPRLFRSYKALNKINALARYLARLADRHDGITPVLLLAELTAESDGTGEAKNLLIAEVKERPSIRGIDRLIEYLIDITGGEARDNLVLLKETTSRLIKEKHNYQCEVCGFTGRSLHWQCPSCKSWSTVKPIHGIEGE